MGGTAVERRVRIKNAAGLHARPCHAFVTIAQAHKSTLRVASGGNEVDGKSILSLMTLGAPVEAELHLRAEGEDAQHLVDALVALVESGFGELD
jgi:phosphotransferase system HPr (HPr) family protein